MNKKIKENKAITLIALAIIIAVLLILAGILIYTLFSENGIIASAQREANNETNTQKGSDTLPEQLEEYAWKLSEDGTKVINKDHPEGIELGSFVNYNCTPVEGAKTSYLSTEDKNGYAEQTYNAESYEYGWRVVGVDNKGQLLLLAEEVVPSVIEEGKDNTWVVNGKGYVVPYRTLYFIQGKTGIENAVNEINAISDIYGHGKYATGGRSLTIEEVDKMTGLNGNNIDGKNTKYEAGEIEEYGNEVTYYWKETDKPYYETSNGLKGELNYSHENEFTYYDENTKKFVTVPKSANATKDLITTVTSTCYSYTVEGTDMKTKNPGLYKTLFTNSSTGAYKEGTDSEVGLYYYLGSDTAYNTWHGPYGFIYTVDQGYVSGNNDDRPYLSGNVNFEYFGIRPAVSLKFNVKLSNKIQRPDGFYSYELGE